MELVESDRGAMAAGRREEHERAIAGTVEAEQAGADDAAGVDAGRGGFECRDGFGGLDEGELAGESLEGEWVGRRERDADKAGRWGVDAVESRVVLVALGEGRCAAPGDFEGTEQVQDHVVRGNGAPGEPGCRAPTGGGIEMEDERLRVGLLPAGDEIGAEGRGVQVDPLEEAGVGAAEYLDDRRFAGALGIEGIDVEPGRRREPDDAAPGKGSRRWGWRGCRRSRAGSARGRGGGLLRRARARAAGKDDSSGTHDPGGGDAAGKKRAAAEAAGRKAGSQLGVDPWEWTASSMRPASGLMQHSMASWRAGVSGWRVT